MSLNKILEYFGFVKKERNQNKYSKKTYPSQTNASHFAEKLQDEMPYLEDLKLNDEQARIFEAIESSGRNFFITGKAGTGKSYLLQYLKQNSQKKLVVTAPTGTAAINVDGQTINSVFWLPPKFLSRESFNSYNMSLESADLLRNIDMLIIDEVSMVRTDMMEAMDWVLRAVRKNLDPFGGVQLVMFGDPYQLPPVVDDKELHRYFRDIFGGHYFFNSPSYQKTEVSTIELSTVIRQKDSLFINILDEIRHGNISNESLEILNSRFLVPIPEKDVLTLTANNRTARRINSEKLDALPGKSRCYKAEISGKIDRGSFPADDILILKKGAQVIFIKNDKVKRWVNGTLGVIETLDQDAIYVSIRGIVFPVVQEKWESIKYRYNKEEQKVEEVVIASFVQFPVRLAWAITIHKAQGQTYDSVVIDLNGGAFTNGQTYTGLSRCKSLDGLFLKQPIDRRDIIIDPTVVSFMNSEKIRPISS